MANERRLIDQAALIEDVEAAEKNAGMGAVVAGTLKRYVKRQPTVDAVEVVRCRECVHCKETGSTTQGTALWCRFHAEETEEDDYCSYGGRVKTEGGKKMEDKKELLKKELVEELAAEVTFAAEVSDWEEHKGREEWGCMPQWFGRAVSAARTVLMMDEALGMKCLETLRAATEGADTEQRLEALGMLINSILRAKKEGGVARID